MPRTRNVYHEDFPYHITARTNNSAPFPCMLDDAWEIYSRALWFYARAFNTRILAFVLMNNHFHLLMSTPEGNLVQFMKQFMKRTSDEIRAIKKIDNHLYGGPYFPTLVNNNKYFHTVFKYVYQNPVRAKICGSVLDYKYSTLHGVIGTKPMIIPTYDDYGFFHDLDQNLRWLDEPLSSDKVQVLRTGLKRQVLLPDRDKNGFRDDTLFL